MALIRSPGDYGNGHVIMNKLEQEFRRGRLRVIHVNYLTFEKCSTLAGLELTALTTSPPSDYHAALLINHSAIN